MTTQYTTILKLALPVEGELSGTWGDVVNDNITQMVEQAVAGKAVVNTWTGNSHTLTTADGTTSESRCAILELTDTGTALTGAGTVVCPTNTKLYIVDNNTAQIVTVKTSGGTGVAVPVGKTMLVYCDGTNVVEGVTHANSLSLGTSTVTADKILDEDNMASDSATAIATQQSIKAYVDSQVGTVDTLSEILANGNTTGANDIDVDSAQKVQFRDAAIYLNSSVDGQLDIVADGEVQIDTALVDINGNLDVSGTTNISGSVSFTKNAIAGVAISTTSRSSNTVTVTTSAVHGLTSGDLVNVNGVVDTSFNGYFTASVSSTTVFTYSQTGADGSSTGGTSTEVVYNLNASGTALNWMNGPLNIAANSGIDGLEITQSGAGNGLHVTGTTGLVGNVDVTGSVTADGLTVGDTSDSQSLIQMLANSTNGANTIHFGDGTSADAYVGYINYAHDSNSMQFSANGSERMRIDASGNVGIGATSALTSTYLSKAFVYTAGGANFAIGGSSDTNDAVLSRFTSFNISNSNSGNESSANFYGVTSIESIVVTTDSNAGDDSGGSILFKTKPEAGALTERLRIDSSGNVGIGTSSPSSFFSGASNLVVSGGSGNGGITIDAGTGSISALHFADGTSGSEPYIGYLSYDHSSDALLLGTSGVERMRIDSSGSTIIKSGNKLILNRTDNATGGEMSYVAGTGFIFDDVNGDGTSFNVGAANRMRIDDAGNVGIGVSAPNEKLESSGAIRVLGTTATSANSGTLSFNGTLFNIESRGPDTSNRGTIGLYQATSNGGSGIQSMVLDASGHIHTGYASSFGGDHVNVLASDGGGISIAQNNAGTATSGTILGSLSFQSYLNGQTLAEADARISAIAAENQSGSAAGTDLAFYTKPNGTGPGSAPTERIRIDDAGNVGIGVTPTAAYKMQVNVATNTVTTGSPVDSSLVNIAGGTTTVGDGVSLQLTNISGAKETGWRLSAVTTSGNNGDLVFNGYAGGADYPERMRIRGDGLVGIGNGGLASTRLAVTNSVVGVNIETTSSNADHEGLIVNRQNSDGIAIAINKAGATVGSISTNGDKIIFGTANAAIAIDQSSNIILPYNPATPGARDAAIDLGYASGRFKDLYLSGFVSDGSNIGLTTRAVVNGGVTALKLQQARGSVTSPTVSNFNGDGNYIQSEVYDGSAFNSIAYIGMVTGTSLDDGDIVFGTALAGSTTVKMTLDEDGNLLVGTTTVPTLAGLAVGSTGLGKNVNVFSSANGSNGIVAIYQSDGTQEGQLYAGTGDVNLFGTSVVKIVAAGGGVKLTSNATSWVSNSDERAKDIIEPISNAVQKVSTLRSVIGKYKTDSEGTRRSFLIAQDVQAVLPEAVDATDEDNLGVRYTETIPLLVAAMKEQQATIEALTARIAALES